MKPIKITFGFLVVAILLLIDVIEVSGNGDGNKPPDSPATETKSKPKVKDGKKGTPPSPHEKKKEDHPHSPPQENKEHSTSPPGPNKEHTPSPTEPNKEHTPSAPEPNKEHSPSPPEVKKEDSPSPQEPNKEQSPSPPDTNKELSPSPPEVKKESSPSPPEVKKESPPIPHEEKEDSPSEEKKTDLPPSSPVENNKETLPSTNPATSKHPAESSPKKDSLVSKGLKMVVGKGVVGKVLIVNPFEPLPTDLTGKTDEELKKYINILVEERELIELRFIYHMSLTLLVGIAAWSLQPYTAVLPVVTAVSEHEEGYSSSLTTQWEEHQERLAEFIVEYMRVKDINPSTLEKNTQGVSVIKVERSPNIYVNLPVWRTEKNAPLPAESMQIRESSKILLKNWWNQK